MQKYTAWMIPIALMALSGCGQKEITNYDTIERTVRRANQKCEETQRELAAALAILDTPDEAAQDKQLKTAVIRKNKEWDKKDWLAMSWRRTATGLQGYRNFPFHTYKDYIDQYQKELKRNWNQLTRIKVVDVNRLRNKVDELIKKLEELSELIETHDRYLAEADKMGLILTRPMSKHSSLFEESIAGM